MNVSVAIDGPVASGKSTVARALARRLGATYLDTGAMYRAVALGALRRGIDPADEPALLGMLAEEPIHVTPDPHGPLGYRIWCGGSELGRELFGEHVAAIVSTVSAHAGVRSRLVERQRAIAAMGPVVMAGRDLGTVVMPDAPVKVFLTATVDARVRRRAEELRAAGVAVDDADLRGDIDARDRLDASRPVAPLRPAAGAVVLDSSELSADAVVDRILALVRRAQQP
jgi:cytidylate kinase